VKESLNEERPYINTLVCSLQSCEWKPLFLAKGLILILPHLTAVPIKQQSSRPSLHANIFVHAIHSLTVGTICKIRCLGSVIGTDPERILIRILVPMAWARNTGFYKLLWVRYIGTVHYAPLHIICTVQCAHCTHMHSTGIPGTLYIPTYLRSVGSTSSTCLYRCTILSMYILLVPIRYTAFCTVGS